MKTLLAGLALIATLGFTACDTCDSVYHYSPPQNTSDGLLPAKPGGS